VSLRRALAVVVLTLPLASCQTLLALLSATFQSPTATYRESKLEAITLDDATVAATFEVMNPNAVTLDVAGIAYEFHLDDQKIFDGQLEGGLKLAPNGTSPLVVPVRVPFASIPGLATTLATKPEAPYVVRAKVSVKTPVGDMSLPIGWSGQLPIPKLPTVKVASAKVSGISFTGARLTVTLDVQNPNVFALPLEALEGSILVAGQSVAKLGIAAAQPLAAKGSAQVQLPVDISFASAGMAVSSAMATQSAEIAVRGEASFGGKKLPLNLSATLH
jgi:LEA14-like dessication related protein